MLDGSRDDPNRGRTDRSIPHKGYAGNAYLTGIVLTQAEAGVMLIRSAEDYNHELCEESNCEVCVAFCRMWHDIYEALDTAYRAGVEEALEALDIRAPRPFDGGF